MQCVIVYDQNCPCYCGGPVNGECMGLTQLPEPPPAPEVKDTNPKDAVGIKKVPFSTVSAAVIAEVGLAMMEGARKYGRHNYRIAGVRASVYYDALNRHIGSWWEGEDIDAESGLSHVTKGIATLVVLRDAMINDMMQDDRPPKLPDGWVQRLNVKAAEIIEKHPKSKDAYTQKWVEEQTP